MEGKKAKGRKEQHVTVGLQLRVSTLAWFNRRSEDQAAALEVEFKLVSISLCILIYAQIHAMTLCRSILLSTTTRDHYWLTLHHLKLNQFTPVQQTSLDRLNWKTHPTGPHSKPGGKRAKFGTWSHGWHKENKSVDGAEIDVTLHRRSSTRNISC